MNSGHAKDVTIFTSSLATRKQAHGNLSSRLAYNTVKRVAESTTITKDKLQTYYSQRQGVKDLALSKSHFKYDYMEVGNGKPQSVFARGSTGPKHI